MKKFPAFVYYPLQWTWGIIQNIVGLIIFAVNGKCPHFRFGLSVGTFWNRGESMSMGMFIFLGNNLKNEDLENEETVGSQVAVHEYGHTFQSMILGPFYLAVISAVSGLWCMIPVFEKLRKTKGISYYKLYTERWANHLGLRITKKIPHGYREVHPEKFRKVEDGQMPERLKKKTESEEKDSLSEYN